MSDHPGRAHFDRLYASVIDELADGPYRPGEHIEVRALARRLQVSTTPLREALSRLVGVGLIEQRLMQGYSLAPLDAGDVSGLYRLRLLCLDLCTRGDQEESLRELARHAADADQLSAAIVAWHGDRILAGLHDALCVRIRLLRRCEDGMFGDRMALPHTLAAAPTMGAIRQLLRGYHAQRSKRAADLALLRGRQR